MSSTDPPSFPDIEIAVRSPGEFVRVLQAVREALADGTLVQVKPPDAPYALDDIRTVSDDGPWPDYVEAHFENIKTGARYRLAVETYHGSGGSWKPG
jgi:hypothetical protein